MIDNQSVIKVEHLRKVYGSLVAVDDISFEVHQGEIFGMVGPNGAGKSTTIECIEGLRRSSEGHIRVLGLDCQSNDHTLRHRIGVQLQESALQDRIKVEEALDLYASFYPQTTDQDELLGQLGLTECRKTHFTKLSGGQKQRLFIALALVGDPEILFLDELTTGLDPQARHTMWDLVRGVRNQGKTVFLTTHFMEEAEQLCDRVAIIDRGRIVALDSPERLVQSLQAETRILLSVEGSIDMERLRQLDGVSRVEASGDKVVLHGRSEGLVVKVVNQLASEGAQIRDLRTEQPTLEDVFLALTGNEIRD